MSPPHAPPADSFRRASTGPRPRRQRHIWLTERFARYLWYYKLTRGGIFLLASGIVSGLLSATSGLAPTYAIVFMLFFVGFFCFLLNLLFCPKLEAECRFAERAMAGAEATGIVHLRNRGRRTAYDVSAGFGKLHASLKDVSEESCIRTLLPGKTQQLALKLKPLKRGFYHLPPLRAFTTFPLNFFRTGRTRTAVAPLVVIPRFTALEAIDIPFGRLYQPGGFALTTSVGDSPDYIGNRDYVPGDSVRRIDSRAWARLGHPAVREYQEEYYCRIALVLDTYVSRPSRRRRADPEGFAELEAAISLAAAAADALTRGEYIIDIFAAGEELYTFRAGLNIAHLDNVLEILSCVEPCCKNPFEKVTPALAEEVGNIATVICVFVDWDASRRHLVRMAAEAGCSVKVVVVREGATSEPLIEEEMTSVALYSPHEVAQGKVARL